MYLLFGSNGNITSKVAKILLSKGKKIRVIGRNAENLEALKHAGAEIAIGDVTDVDFLNSALQGVDSVFTMLPPVYAASNMRFEQNRMGLAIATAIAGSEVRKVINLSSSGAHLMDGTGPIVALYQQEQRLNAINNINVLHLRPGYFFENHLAALGSIKNLGVYADMINSDSPIPTIGTNDVAVVVARELENFNTVGKQVLHLRAPKLYSQAEATDILGNAIGHQGLQHVMAEPSQAIPGMISHGFSPDVAEKFAEMAQAFSSSDIVKAVLAGPTEITTTALDEFAESIFAPVFRTMA